MTQRRFDEITENSEQEIGKPCCRLDCGQRADWIIKVDKKTYYLCRLHFQMYDEVYNTRLTGHIAELKAYLNSVKAQGV